MSLALEIEIAGGDTATPLNMAKRVRLIAAHADLRQARVLDAGCGAGEYVFALGELGAEVLGIEYLAEKVEQFERSHPGDGRVRRGDIARIDTSDCSFDVVLMNEVLEHVPDEGAALREVWRILRPGGRLLLFSPNRLYPFETHGVDSYGSGGRIDPIRTFGLPYLPLWITTRLVRPWARNYWPTSLRRLVRTTGFRILHHEYVWQTFENISKRRGRAFRAAAPLLRTLSAWAERVPLFRSLGVSQLIVAERT
jgi:SAM-dependent methyltransferase